MRLDGRLKYREFHLTMLGQFPIILPQKHRVTVLIVKHFHEKENNVSGTRQTPAAPSTRFWIVFKREEIREWEKVYNGCRKQKSRAAKQIMAALLPIRLRIDSFG